MSEYWDKLTAITEETKKLDKQDIEASRFADSVLVDIQNRKQKEYA